MLQDHSGWVVAAAVALIILVGLGLAARAGMRSRSRSAPSRSRPWRRRPHRNEFRPEGVVTEHPTRRAAVIVNPTKFDDVSVVQGQIVQECARLGWAEPLFILTTERDTGSGQAKEALSKGVDLVCALGGDGTVRAVAGALVGSDTPMGLLPMGTGNLLARNLDLRVDDLGVALEVALTGQNKRVDVGRLTVDTSGEDQRPVQHVFLVMAGLGFDAAIMADAPETLKARVGPAAYVVSGAKNLRGPQFRVRIKVDDQEELIRRARTVVIGNCGKLLGGLVLMPEAEIDDGLLDTVILSPKGVVGWAAVAARLASKKRKGHQRVDHHTSASVQVRADRPQEVQVDGDPVGTARAITAEVLPGALLVRVGAPA